MVVEATHAEKPLTIVFQSGSLIHHRCRTTHTLARSCLIIAFHLEQDHPGQLIPPEHLEGLTEQGSLLGFMFGQQCSYGKIPFGGSKTKDFLNALSQESAIIGIILDKLHSEMDAEEVIKPEDCQLREEQVEQWKKASTTAPTVEELKTEANHIPLGEKLSSQKLAELVGRMMFDKTVLWISFFTMTATKRSVSGHATKFGKRRLMTSVNALLSTGCHKWSNPAKTICSLQNK